MDEFKPEDELKPDPSDRRTGRSRQSSERDNEPQINFDDVDLDADDRRPSRSRNAHDTDDRRPTRAQKERNEEPEIEEEIDESEDETVDEERVERRPRKRKKAASKPASRQYMMMGVGILVLLLLIIGIGSALKAPSTSSRVLILQAMRPIRRMGCSQRREPRLRKILSRMFLCRRSLLRRLKGKPRRQRMVNNVLKCRVT